MGLNQVLVLYTQFEIPVTAGAYSRYYHSLSRTIQKRIDGYLQPADKVAGILGKQLIISGLAQLGYEPGCIDSLKYPSHNRPYLEDIPDLDFNISHSGSLVICAFSKQMQVGIDIEKIKPVKLAALKVQFAADEWEEIENAADPEKLFYQYWVQKEALVKADGFAADALLQDIEIFDNRGLLNNRSWHLNPLEIDPAYCCWMASAEIPSIEVNQVYYNP